MSETRAYVEQLPIVKELFDHIYNSRIAPLVADHLEQFLTVSAAASMHHNFTHGLVIHTAEVWQSANAFLNAIPCSVAFKSDTTDLTKFRHDELLVAVVQYDFAKIVQYEPAENHCWKKVPMICNQETWTLRELARHGISLTYNELIGLLHAEGGYTEFTVEWRPLSVILHAADLWSSQAMRAIWNPAEAMNVKCPKCQGAMRAISGPTGLFYGCTKYPGCRGTRNATEVPPIGEKFFAWLKQMYPVA